MEPISDATSQFMPATYAIQVRGTVDPRWSDRLGGMRITLVRPGDAANSVLVGRIPDQGALLGDLGFPLLAVARLGPPGAV
jgi:hypothetical protein